jgi:ABC-type bacteriocin/lantibiotic exporter with double-glycine peptidase domain
MSKWSRKVSKYVVGFGKRIITTFPLELVGGLEVPRFIQPDDYSCGPTALAGILRYHDFAIKMKKLRKICHLDPGGTTTGDLARAARQLGFVARYREPRVKVMRQEIMRDNCPVLICRFDPPGSWEEAHWSIAAWMDEDENLITADPWITAKRKIKRRRISELIEDPVICIRPR